MNLDSAKLILVDGPQIGKQFPLTNLPMSIGRTDAATAVIADGSISRKHAEISATATAVNIADLGSKNGIEVNGRKAQGAVELFDGDRITIGKVKLKCVMPHHLRPVAPKVEEVAPVVAEEPQTAVASQGVNSNLILAAVLGIGLILAVLALVLVYDNSAAPPKIYTLAVGQEVLVATNYNIKQVDIQNENSRVVRVRPSRTLSNVIWLKGGGMGNSLIKIVDKEGRLLQSYKAIVRGRFRDYENELGLMDMDADDRVRLAKNLALEAASLKRDSLYTAINIYDKALAVLKDVGGQEELYLSLQKKKEAFDNEFEATFKAIGQDYMMARSNGSVEGQYTALRKIKALVPDENHPYYQKAKYYFDRLKARGK